MTQKLKAILADDEESARDVLENLLARFCPQVELLAKCKNITETVSAIEQLKPDVVFLDIEMPNYAGFEIVRFFKEIDFDIIFITAYDQYAVRAFEVSATDYLLKPIDIDRLKTAIEKAVAQRTTLQLAQRLNLLSQTLETKQIKKIAVADKGHQHIIPTEDIIAIEAQEAYCIIHTKDKKYTASKNLKHFETMLEGIPDFIRVHKSWIINTQYLSHYSKSDLTIHLTTGIIAKLSKYKKAEFEEAIVRS